VPGVATPAPGVPGAGVPGVPGIPVVPAVPCIPAPAVLPVGTPGDRFEPEPGIVPVAVPAVVALVVAVAAGVFWPAPLVPVAPVCAPASMPGAAVMQSASKLVRIELDSRLCI
jgi:hypothetical protein